jgi:hypothetical protein
LLEAYAYPVKFFSATYGIKSAVKLLTTCLADQNGEGRRRVAVGSAHQDKGRGRLQ